VTAPARGPHVPTLGLGLVLAGIAAGFGLGQLTDVRVDLGLVLPVGMVALGALLVLGAVLTGLRRGR
jgi:hypothetical protein